MESTLTIARIASRQRYWRAFPPAHMLLKSIVLWLGAQKASDFGSLDDGEAAAGYRGGLAELRAMYPGGIGSSDLRG